MVVRYSRSSWGGIHLVCFVFAAITAARMSNVRRACSITINVYRVLQASVASDKESVAYIQDALKLNNLLYKDFIDTSDDRV